MSFIETEKIRKKRQKLYNRGNMILAADPDRSGYSKMYGKNAVGHIEAEEYNRLASLHGIGRLQKARHD